MISRYSRKELIQIWSEENKYKIWLDVEIAAAEAMEKYKIIPKGVASVVKKKGKIIDTSKLIIEGYKSLNLDGLIIIGGDGSMRILKKLDYQSLQKRILQQLQLLTKHMTVQICQILLKHMLVNWLGLIKIKPLSNID